MTQPDDELRGWMTTWRQVDASPPAGDVLRRYVRRRSAMLTVSIVGEAAVAAGGVLLLGYLALMRADPIERLVMGTLALICAVMLVFGWWNWRGMLRAVSETTAAYLALSSTRLARIRRGLIAGWLLLGAEMAVFIPWVWYRTRAESEAGRWPWMLLATVAALAVAWLIALGRWLNREEAIVGELRRQSEDVG